MTQEIVLRNNKRLCGCGCGTELVDRYGKYDTLIPLYYYIRGHNNRGRLLARKTRVKTTQGYWKVMRKGHLIADKCGYVLEHILVFEDTYDCPLLRWTHIHHRDGVKTNNVWYNLKGMMNWQHARFHNLKDMDNRKCSRCGSSQTYMRKKGKVVVEPRPFWHSDKKTGQDIHSNYYYSNKKRNCNIQYRSS
jgi:hypothetical protein